MDIIEQFAGEAHFLDRFAEHLALKRDHWLFDNMEKKDHWPIICEFVQWVCDDTAKDKLAKRGPQELSYEHCQKQWAGTPNE